MKTIQEFINFYKSIPKSKWCIGEYSNSKGQHCAVGHLRAIRHPSDLLYGFTLDTPYYGFGIAPINDGSDSCPVEFKSIKHPKDRILKYLRTIKKLKKGK